MFSKRCSLHSACLFARTRNFAISIDRAKNMQNTKLNWCAFSAHREYIFCSLSHYLSLSLSLAKLYAHGIYEYETAGIGSWWLSVQSSENVHKLWIVKTAKRNYVVHIPKIIEEEKTILFFPSSICVVICVCVRSSRILFSLPYIERCMVRSGWFLAHCIR